MKFHSFYSVRSLCLVIAFLCCPACVASAANPYIGGHGFRVKHNGIIYSGLKNFTTVFLASQANFNGVQTTAGNDIDNAQTPFGFAFNAPIGGAQVRVTVAKSDDAWDDHYTGAARVSGSTFAKNCFGHALGKNFWVPTPQCTNTILADEWKGAIYGTTLSLPAVFHIAASGHMVAVESYCDIRTEGSCTTCYCSKTSEKNQSSGVYEYTYLCPGGGEPDLPWSFHIKK